MNKVAIYVRVSTKEQAEEGYSIDEQIDLLTNYCNAQRWKIYDTYIDAGISGGTLDRPNLERLTRDAHRKRFDVLIVYDLKRLGRSQRNNIAFIEDVLEKNDIKFVSLTENFDTSTPVGKAVFGMLSSIAQLDRDTITQRLMMGKVGRAKSGKPMMFTNVSFGYTYSPATQELSINQAEAIIVRRIFDEYMTGMSLLQLMKFLNENNILRNGKKWNYQGLKRILRNPVYIGKIRYNGIEYPGLHKPIIDETVFYKVQKELDARQYEMKQKGKNRQFKAKYMLSGTGKCGYCGAPLRIKTGNKRLDGTRTMAYQCFNRYPKKNSVTVYNNNEKCNSKYYDKNSLEDNVLAEIRKLQLNPNLIDTMFRKTTIVDTLEITKQIKVLENKINRLNKLYLNDLISLEQLKKDAHGYKEQIASLETELDKEDKNKEKQQNKEYFKQTIGTKDITTLPYEKQVFIAKALIDKVLVKKGSIKILWKI